MQYLDELGLKGEVKNKIYSQKVSKGKIADQEPNAGISVAVGETVNIWLSKGEKPDPEPITFSQPVTVTVSANGSASEPSNKQGKSSTTEHTNKSNKQSKTTKNQVKGHGAADKSVHVKIVYSDANVSEQVFVEEDITQTKTYTNLQLTVDDDKSASVWVYKSIDSDLQLVQAIHKTYQQVKEETKNNGGA